MVFENFTLGDSDLEKLASPLNSALVKNTASLNLQFVKSTFLLDVSNHDKTVIYTKLHYDQKNKSLAT